MKGLSVDDDVLSVLPHAYEPETSSFVVTLRRHAPDALPALLQGGGLPPHIREQTVDGTTVLALISRDGVVVAGDRRATSGHLISRDDMRKVFPADGMSAIAISGTAGPAMELAKVFATELEHYEKVEGEPLSLEGKSTKLAGMVRAHLPLAMQGLVIVPLFAGVEPRTGVPRIFEYDPVGGRYVATDLAAVGSGSLTARATLRRLVDPQADTSGAVRTAMEALYDAAEQDSATGGPDLIRRIYPNVVVIDADGYRELSDDEVIGHVEAVIDRRRR
ncbi:MAG: proteasome subunit beta [Nitriliruptoraceae bacterium]